MLGWTGICNPSGWKLGLQLQEAFRLTNRVCIGICAPSLRRQIELPSVLKESVNVEHLATLVDCDRDNYRPRDLHAR
jgi:hypothetical protein